MNLQDINFPVYRCYKNKKSYFKILNPREFEEIQVIGKKKVLKLIKATRYPEIKFVQDLVLYFQEMASEITEKDYLTIKKDSH